MIIERRWSRLQQRLPEGGARPGARLGEAGSAHDLQIQRYERSDCVHAGLCRKPVERHRVGRIRCDRHVVPARCLTRELTELAREHCTDDRDIHQDEHHEGEHAEGHRRAKAARQLVREPEPHVQGSVRDLSDRVTDRALLLRDEHHGRADQHQALRDEQEDADAAVQRKRDRHRDDSPQQHHNGQGRCDRGPREIARERGPDPGEHQYRSDHQAHEGTARQTEPGKEQTDGCQHESAVERTKVGSMRRRLADVSDGPDDVETAQPNARHQHGCDRDHEPDHEAALHARPGKREMQRESRVRGPVLPELGGKGHDDSPEPETDERPRDCRCQRVAPTFGGESADQRRPPKPDGAQHAELGLPFVGEHEEDVDEQEDAREHAERAERRVDLRELAAVAIGPIEQGHLLLVDVVLQRAEPGDQRATHRVRQVRARLDATPIRDHDRRLRRNAQARSGPCEKPGDRSGRDERVVGGVGVARPETGHAQARQNAHDS